MQLQTLRSWICVAFFLQLCCLSFFYFRLAFFHRLSFGHIHRKIAWFLSRPSFPPVSAPQFVINSPTTASSSSTPGSNNLQHNFSRRPFSHTVSIIGCFESGSNSRSVCFQPLFARSLPCRPKMLAVVARGYPHTVAHTIVQHLYDIHEKPCSKIFNRYIS